jgi:DNA-binding XRE family transcriptional regulator
LTINASKIKYLINRKNGDDLAEEIEINRQKYTNVEISKYLSSLVTNAKRLKQR